jgi:DNA-binding transcriptional LysR family regulator
MRAATPTAAATNATRASSVAARINLVAAGLALAILPHVVAALQIG